MLPELLWFLAGLVLILAELLLPGVVLMFFGLGAWCAALSTRMGWTEGLGEQSIVFAATSMVMLFGLRRFVKKWFVGDTTGKNNAMLEEFLGRQVRVLQDIPGGSGTGRVELKGAGWQARSPVALARGSTAVVRARDGLVLVVEPE
jgi:inner membrane protein